MLMFFNPLMEVSHRITNVITFKLTYCIFTPLNFNTEFFLQLDNEDKMSSKRRAINLISLLFLLSSISKSLLIKILCMYAVR